MEHKEFVAHILNGLQEEDPETALEILTLAVSYFIAYPPLTGSVESDQEFFLELVEDTLNEANSYR